MATLTTTPIKVFVSGETVTPTKLNELSQSTVALTAGSIVAADIASDAVTNVKIASGVDASKLTTGTLPADRIGSDAITTARINNAAVTAAKLDGAQTGSAPIYAARAWVRFNGSIASPTIGASGNVSSVTKNSTGNYTINFTTAMPDTLYTTFVTGRRFSPGAAIGMIVEGGTYTTSAVQVRFVATDSSAVDVDMGNVVIFR